MSGRTDSAATTDGEGMPTKRNWLGGHEGEEQCSSCGRWLGPDSFEDGLRCKFCQEADEEAEPSA